MARKRIGMVGYYGYGNYGDELFMKVFKKVFYDCELVVMQDMQKRPFYHDGLEEKIASCDALIIGGGDLVIGNYWTDQYFEKPFLQKPIYIHGVGVPTWSGEKADVVERLASFFKHASIKHINVRDVESARWIKAKLEPAVPIEVTTDMVCALDLPAGIRHMDGKIFGLISRRQTPGEIKYANIRALCDKARALGYRVKNIVLGTGIDRADDLQGLAEFDYPDMDTVGSENLDDLTREIGGCDVIASMKFHGCVVSLMYGIPAITLITTDKFRNLYRAIERPELVGHHTHANLADRLTPFVPVIPRLTRQFLRRDAQEGLNRLRRKVMDEVE